MDPFRLCIALGPLGVYLLLIGALNLSRRPFLTTGARDIAALGIALSGLILIGPVELLVPRVLALQFGSYAWLYWLLLASMYFSVLTLLALSARPRLSLYNITLDESRQLLAGVAQSLDPQAHLVGESLLLPSLNVQLHMEAFAGLRAVALAPVGPRQSYRGWKLLEHALAAALYRTEVPPNPAGIGFMMVGMLIGAMILVRWITDPQAVAKAMVEMLGI
jgi:hypothetical protein